MNIACLGWGSLIWKPGPVPIAGDWCTDGPALPIEFSRIGDGGELATAICLNAPAIPVYWALLATDTLEIASEALREREQIPRERQDGIGTLITADIPLGMITEWALARQIDAVIWTALPPRVENIEGRIPSIEEALAYLDHLEGKKREHAMRYIAQVPEQIDTPYRRAIKQTLGWGY